MSYIDEVFAAVPRNLWSDGKPLTIRERYDAAIRAANWPAPTPALRVGTVALCPKAGAAERAEAMWTARQQRPPVPWSELAAQYGYGSVTGAMRAVSRWVEQHHDVD